MSAKFIARTIMRRKLKGQHFHQHQQSGTVDEDHVVQQFYWWMK